MFRWNWSLLKESNQHSFGNWFRPNLLVLTAGLSVCCYSAVIFGITPAVGLLLAVALVLYIWLHQVHRQMLVAVGVGTVIEQSSFAIAWAKIELSSKSTEHVTSEDSDQQQSTNSATNSSHVPQSNLTHPDYPKQNKELSIINQIGQAFINPALLTDVKSTCRAILEQPALRELFHFDTAEICLWDEETRLLQKILRIPEEAARLHGAEQYRVGQGYSGWIASHRAPLLVADVANHPQVVPKVGLKNFPYGSLIGVPLKMGAKFLGTLELIAKETHAFTSQDITNLEIVANQIAVALEYSRLFSQTNQKLQQRVDELAGLQRVSNELNSTLDLNKILNVVLDEAMRLSQADFGDVYFYDAATETLVTYKDQKLTTLPNQTGGKSVHPRTVPASVGIVGRAVRTGQSVLVADVHKDEDFVDRGTNSRSEVVVPIYFEEQPVGVINLESPAVDFFNSSQLRYLEALANHAAVAIGNAQAYQQQMIEREQAGRRAEQLARLSDLSNAYRTNRPLHDILEDVVFAIAESVGYDVAMISLVRDSPPKIYPEVGAGIPVVELEQLKKPERAQPLENLQIVMRDEFEIGQSYFIPARRQAIWQERLNIPYIEKDSSAQALLTSQAKIPLLFNPTPDRAIWQTGDLLLVPLVDVGNNIIGVLTVANPVDGRRPDNASVQTLETFANHAAAAIENAQLFEREKQRRRVADTLRGVAEAISSQLELDDLLNIVLQELSQVVDYDRANVQMLQEDQLVIIGGRGWTDSQKIIGTSFSMSDDNPNRRVLEIQEPVIIQDTSQAYVDFFATPMHSQTKSWLGVPLTYGANVLGVMILDKRQPNFFTQEDIQAILAFANQVAVALQNARLFDEARRQVRQLATLTEVAQSINRTLELDEVLNLVLDAVFDLVGHDQGSIWLIDKSSNTVKMANTSNISSFLVELFNESDIPVDSEPFASVIKSGQVFTIQGSTPHRDNIANFGLPFPDDVTYVPLKTEEGIIGILAIEVVIRNKTMLKLVVTLADLAAVAIESARLLENTRRRATEMQTLFNLGVEVNQVLEVHQVMQTVIANTLTLSDTQLGAILFEDDQTKRHIIENAATTPQLAGQLGLGKSSTSRVRQTQSLVSLLWNRLTQHIARIKQPIVASLATLEKQLSAASGSDSEAMIKQEIVIMVQKLGVKAILGVPVYVQNEINGAIFVASLLPRHFDNQDVQLLSFVANQASVAVRNAQLVQRLNQLTGELEQRVAQRTEELARTLQDLTEERDRVGTLYQITRELSASFDLDRVLNEALNLINRAIGISHGAILLLDRESNQLMYRAALGRNRPLPRGGVETPYKSGYGLAGKIIESRESRLVPDLTKDRHWIPTGNPNDERRSAIGVPLSTGDDMLGVMLLFHPEVDYFTLDQLKLVTAAGAQVATAVNNSELYRLITDQAQRLGVLYRKQASEAAKNQAILEGITDGVLVLDTNREVVLVNPKAAEILSLHPAEVENQPLRQILGRSGSPVELELTERLYKKLLTALDQVGSDEPTVQFRIEVGVKVITVSLASVWLGAEEMPSFVAVLRDISREAEVERLKNEFISTVSHELRTPMTSVKGYSDLLLSGNARVGALNETQHHFVKVIQSNANRLTELVNDILEISRIETGRIKLEFTSLDIIETISDVATSFEGQLVKKDMNLALHLPDHLPNVYADKARLTQVLVNLIGNAWQYTPEGGNIDVSARQTGDFLQIDVADSGIGIVENDLEYIFDRFFRSERTEVQVVDGTGLGLSITRSFVEMLGGQIWVNSTIDVGTTFSFTVPLDAGQDDDFDDEIAAQADADLLVIEDDPAVISYLKPKLEGRGYQPLILHEPEKVLEYVNAGADRLRAIFLGAALATGNSFSLLELLLSDQQAGRPPVLLASLRSRATGPGLVSQLAGSVSPVTDEQAIIKLIRQVLEKLATMTSTKSDRLASRLRHTVLIIENDRQVSGWLRHLFASHGYEAICAFNSRQGLDMVFGNSPDIIFLRTTMPDINQKSVLAHLRQEAETKNIPVVLIVDEAENYAGRPVEVWGRQFWTSEHQSVLVKDLLKAIFPIETTPSHS